MQLVLHALGTTASPGYKLQEGTVGLSALVTRRYLRLAALGTKMYKRLAALVTELYQGLAALVTSRYVLWGCQPLVQKCS